jgi:N utilization substance protein B
VGGHAEAVARRRDARRQALNMLFQADATDRPPGEVLATWFAEGGDADVPNFARELVEGVASHRVELDDLISRHAHGWTIERMPVVDRTVLRLATFELLHRADTPVAVAIDEAVQAARELSTEASGRFVNGVLGRIAREEAVPER